MCRVISFRAVAVGLAALAGSGGDGAARKIADGGKLAKQIGSSVLQVRQ
jgi:hypothetical protein